MNSGIDQQCLSIKGRIVKARYFPRAMINDMYNFIKPLLKKPPIISSYILVPTMHQEAHQELFYIIFYHLKVLLKKSYLSRKFVYQT